MLMSNDVRDSYRSTGKTNWLRMLAAASLAFAVALLMAYVLSELLFAGYYIVFLVPFFAALPLFGALYFSFWCGQCRNRAVTMTIAVVAAALLYLGYFHACIVKTVGVWVPPNVEMLSNYVKFRMATDEAVDAARPNNAAPKKNGIGRSREIINWFAFALEFGAVTAGCVAVALSYGSRAYCERCRGWTLKLKVTFPAGLGEQVLSALESGQLESVKNSMVQLLNKASCCEVTVECCPGGGSGDEPCPVYFSVQDVRRAEGFRERIWGLMQNRYGQAMHWLVKKLVLSADEIGQIAQSFPA